MCPFLIVIFLVSFLVFYRSFKKMMAEKVEEIEIKIGSLENKIDELYTIIYKLGNTIKIIQESSQKEEKTILPEPVNRSRKSKVPPQKRRNNQSIAMKKNWEIRRAKASSAEAQLQAMLEESKSQHIQ